MEQMSLLQPHRFFMLVALLGRSCRWLPATNSARTTSRPAAAAQTSRFCDQPRVALVRK